MPVIKNIKLSIDTNTVFRRQGVAKNSIITPRVAEHSKELLKEISKLCLLEPLLAYETYSVVGIEHDQLYVGGNSALHGSLFKSTMEGAKRIVAAVCTIGPKLEKKSKSYITGGEVLRGLLLDGIGSAALDSLAQEACRIISLEAISDGYQTGSPISPGAPRFPLSEQQHVLKLAQAERVGISLTSSGIMQPLKSCSMVIGLGQEMKTWSATHACARCPMRRTCRYRVS
ncbi:MAG: hypothetical protein JXB43_09490 [Dehalococcoidia bacterium]|nr:hypothetical protein [Dehalococcoidia bacterium]